MKIAQITGPFAAGQRLIFNALPQNILSYDYIAIGIETPQVPPITEVENLEPMMKIKINGGRAIEPYYLNSNDILEFHNLKQTLSNVNTTPLFTALKDMDYYTIITIAYTNEDI